MAIAVSCWWILNLSCCRSISALSAKRTNSAAAEDDLQRASELKSGERVKVMLNAGLSPEHEEKLGSFVDGIGLYRTEIPFMLQSGFPSEEEQVAQYQGMLQMFNSKPVTLRTTDIGADKQLPYMPISEENPCLGWRGIRITLDQPEIFLIRCGRCCAPTPPPATSAFCCRW